MSNEAIVALDFESILVPEIWPYIAEQTGIEELRVTSREFPDFDALTERRLNILKEHRVGLSDIQSIIEMLEPLEGARAFLDDLRSKYEVVILSGGLDKFIEPLIRKIGNPPTICYALQTNPHELAGFKPVYKKEVVRAVKSRGRRVVAVGDSYVDIEMLKEADEGILFNASENIASEYPEFSSVRSYEDLKKRIEEATHPSEE